VSKHVGRFEIIRELGRGAQSIVYLARDPHLQRQVAIKTLHFARSDPQQNRQLLEEARMVSQLRHPNIVPIFEAAEEQGDLYLVFQYVPGKNLAEYLKARAVHCRRTRAIAIMQAILDAIAHAHAAGIIHRDLKPSNILIDDDGVPRVMDFGIAARAEALAGDGGQLTGTPAYMAPEYIAQRTSSERSDIFSAGLVFYELLTGKRAVPGNDIQQVMKRIAARTSGCRRQPAACLTSAWCISCIGRWRVIRRADTNPQRRCARRWTTTLSRKPRRLPPIPGRARSTSCCGGCGTRAIFRLCRSRSGRSTGLRPRRIRAFPKSRTRSSRISR
jgi:serine/threonine protein kinase